MVAENYREVEARVAAACKRSGRKREDVTLIAVSKTKPVEMIRELMAIGVKDFGENKPQELKTKTEEITEPLRWHLIGNLQTNKVKYVVGRACLIHSVSSLHLAEALQKEAAKKDLVCRVLVEVNIAGEETKSGVSPEEAAGLARQIAALPNLEVCGLMAIAPPVESPEENRGYFRSMRLLKEKIASMGLDRVSMDELSMGMTGDFEVAIEEGATLVRVGTAIFGSRAAR
ncbi:YggS family pyridoxal phosphate-dependent enzyme [Cuneatibacter sp. NSJ-177]|uniref:YggS family pyridoxal phosphate-dependent enzyme n=1 Tax=Cuneatibacter sp. NSJ-177 TaxID=2931401 RepID=UPI001FD38A34|nr:YggS family pyridoxal phosphate-dependent enzyme [Cuneatibacter sp. NSJ-177]MCJ7835632.1 YggS family pyridoxal phosphate-dependent enzyme [Cuneatibacter sp. NSJ-177]